MEDSSRTAAFSDTEVTRDASYAPTDYPTGEPVPPHADAGGAEPGASIDETLELLAGAALTGFECSAVAILVRDPAIYVLREQPNLGPTAALPGRDESLRTTLDWVRRVGRLLVVNDPDADGVLRRCKLMAVPVGRATDGASALLAFVRPASAPSFDESDRERGHAVAGQLLALLQTAAARGWQRKPVRLEPAAQPAAIGASAAGDGLHPTGDQAPTGARRVRALGRVWRVLREEFRNIHPRLALADVLVAFLPSLSFCRLRTAIYRAAGVSIGPRTLIFGRLSLIGPGRIQSRLRIGADTIVNGRCFFDLSADIDIGDRVSVGHHAMFVTAQHEVGSAAARAGQNRPRPIVVGAGSWIAAGAVLLPGVTVAQSSIVAAGAVVTHPVRAHRIVAGVPAREIRSLPDAP